MGHEAIELDEAALVEQQIQPLPRAEFSLLVLLGDPVGAAALLGECLTMMELLEELPGVWHGANNSTAFGVRRRGFECAGGSVAIGDGLRWTRTGRGAHLRQAHSLR